MLTKRRMLLRLLVISIHSAPSGSLLVITSNAACRIRDNALDRSRRTTVVGDDGLPSNHSGVHSVIRWEHVSP
jgi:hypothetical protein